MNDISNNNNELEVKGDDPSYQIVLPCDVKDFRKFVSGLLGKQQVHKGTEEGSFHIEHKEISNIFHLINQRIESQNHGSLIHLSIKVLYNDGTSITHNDVNHFEDYYPTSNAHPTEIVINFTYLIKFNNKEVSEKQEIEVVISVSEMRLHEERAWMSGGVFSYRILHTDRTWASDIANVLKVHSKNFINKPNKVVNWLRTNSDDIFPYSFFVVILSLYSIAFFSMKSTYFIDNPPLNWQIKLTENLVTIGYISAILYCISKTLDRLGAMSLFGKTKSFITLTDKDHKRMRKLQRKNLRRTLIYFVTLAGNIGSGIVATVIYNNTIS